MSASTTTAVPQVTRRGGTMAAHQRREGWIMVSPAILTIVVLSIFPLLYSLLLSLVRWDLQTPGNPFADFSSFSNSFVGAGNYSAALSDARIYGALKNTAIIVFAGVALEFLLGFGLALVLVDELRGKRIIIPLLMLPVMMVPIVVAFTWRMLWDTQYGAINQVLGWVLGYPVVIVWLGRTESALVAIIVTEVWQWTPFMFLVLLAGLAGVNPEQYEAASIDGANWWQTLRNITLPALAPVIAVALLFRALDVFKLFDLVFLFTQGGPGTTTETISWYVYQIGFKFFRMGYAAALSYLIVIALSVVATIYVKRFLRQESQT